MGDELHRLVKLAVDTGEAQTVADAVQLFEKYRLAIRVGPDAARSPSLQAAVLTTVNTGRRCFLGGVLVAGDLDVDLLVPWRDCTTLGEAIVDLQGVVVADVSPEIPRVVIGNVPDDTGAGEFVVRATFDGWSGGVFPLEDGQRLQEQHEFTPAGVLAGALAASEAFQFVRGNVLAGRREVGLSLWRPEEPTAWLNGEVHGPVLERLPSRLWLIGLGHLGQAFLWTLGFLPYALPEELELVLQDHDALVEANDSTSLLTTRDLLGEKKTRAMARWCEERGFRATIQERRFAADFRTNDGEPPVALCGVDNPLARAALEGVGFGRVIEAGLGRGTREYLDFQVHTFPAQKSARERWGSALSEVVDNDLVDKPAYKDLSEKGLDQCGLTTLAGRTVGAPFVGAATAAIVVAELLRLVLGEHRYEVIDGSLRSLDHRRAIISEAQAEPFNPGSTTAIPYAPVER